ncbi:hypothetical protein MSG28_004548 [Choristoneura fumiferana]|uniref:Uncharacterized protein n=1 Tax=Choristoneura fumiferana TaxID=7141 RepID=A0ACC0K799_CHOFU|nr:hypothetical protein MSG28_004548 [Choristoneura fumiferana]
MGYNSLDQWPTVSSFFGVVDLKSGSLIVAVLGIDNESICIAWTVFMALFVVLIVLMLILMALAFMIRKQGQRAFLVFLGLLYYAREYRKCIISINTTIIITTIVIIIINHHQLPKLHFYFNSLSVSWLVQQAGSGDDFFDFNSSQNPTTTSKPYSNIPGTKCHFIIIIIIPAYLRPTAGHRPPLGMRGLGP